MKNIKKFVLCVVFAICVLLMFVTGVYAMCSIGLALCAVEGNIVHILLLLLSGVASGFICYIVHKITF